MRKRELGIPRYDDHQLVRKQVFPRLRFPAFFLEIIHLQEVGREEDIDRRAFVDLPRKAAGRAEIEFYLAFGLCLVAADFLQNIGETRRRRDQNFSG